MNHSQPLIPESEIEIHPFPPFIPEGAKVLIMGTFPPQPKRWAMNFYYPNRTNDFWYAMGLIFFGDKDALYCRPHKEYRLEEIKALLKEKGIAMSDTGYKIYREKGNASDKFLNILQPVDLDGLTARMPDLRGIATTGEKAAEVIASITDTPAPKIGEFSLWHKEDSHLNNDIQIWRMPSTSRAYPLPLQKKAEYYEAMFRSVGIL